MAPTQWDGMTFFCSPCPGAPACVIKLVGTGDVFQRLDCVTFSSSCTTRPAPKAERYTPGQLLMKSVRYVEEGFPSQLQKTGNIRWTAPGAFIRLPHCSRCR